MAATAPRFDRMVPAAPDAVGSLRRELRRWARRQGASPATQASVALAFSEAGFLRASRMHAASSRDAEDARAFVRYLARRRAIADEVEFRVATPRLVREGKSHAVVKEGDGVRRVRRVWIAEEGT